MRNFFKPAITLSVLALALTACGGSDDTLTETGDGDGGQSGGGSGGQQSNQAGITRDNAEAIASSIWGVRKVNTRSEGLLESSGFDSIIPSMNTKPRTLKISSVEKQGSAIQSKLAAIPQTGNTACNSGSMDITVDISTGSNKLPEPKAGDSISFVFNQCSVEEGTSADGSMSLNIDALEGDFPFGNEIKIAMTMKFDQLTTTIGQEKLIANGDLSTTIEKSPVEASISISSTLFEYTEGDDKESLSNLKLKDTINLTDNSMAFEITGTFTNSSMKGPYSFDTTTPMLKLSQDMYPSSGVIKVTGSQSSLTLKALNKTDVEIALDLDGDDEIDDTINTTWEKLIDDL